MSKGMVIVGIIILGIVALVVINITQQYQQGNELDYYLLEETTEAAMLDAVDIAYYRQSGGPNGDGSVNGGTIRMNREKFAESFLRRFAQSINASRNYDIKMIDINEIPPKASVSVRSSTIATFQAETVGIQNTIDAILETKYVEHRLMSQIK